MEPLQALFSIPHSGIHVERVKPSHRAHFDILKAGRVVGGGGLRYLKRLVSTVTAFE